MKKIIAMLLMLVMSCSLVACGGKEQELEPAEGQEAIEITTENWQTYFEVKDDVDVYKEKDAEGKEIVKAYMDKYICLKEEYKENFAVADVTFTYKLGKQEVKTLTYNIADGTYTLADSTAQFAEDKEVEEDKLPTVTVTAAETQIYINLYADAEGASGNTYVCDTMLRPELEFTKVEGKIIVNK